MSRLIHYLLSLMPEKEAKRAFRNRNPCDACRHTCPPRKPAVFLTHASPPSHIAADSEHINSAFVGSRRNRWVRAGEGFNRRVSISVHYSSAWDLRPLGAPKLSVRAVGIESVRYDFDRFLWLLFPHLSKILKSGIPYSGTFSERK